MKTLFRILLLLLGIIATPALAQLAQRYNVPYTTAFDTTGVVSPGAQLFFYQTGTSTPANTYSDSGLTTPNSNPVVANGAGLFTNIFLTPSQQYKVVMEDTNGNTIWTADPVYSGGPYVAYVASIAALRLISIKSFGTVYVVQYSSTTGQGGGQFSDTGASSCSTVSPTGGDDNGIYIQTAGNCAKRNTGGQPFNVTWFGAICNGIQVTDGVSTTGGTATTISSASAKWGNVVPGEQIVVNGAAASSNQLVTTVVSKTSSSALVITTGATTAGTGETVSVYTDDTTAIANTITAANAANVVVTLPAGQSCGFANPGSFVSYNFTGPGLDLNSGSLWMGQTGPVYQTGVVFSFNKNYQGVWGHGIINGLYQTNQNIQQGYSGTLVFQGSGTIIAPYLKDVTITNTKARGFFMNQPLNAVVSNVLLNNCGDLTYSASYAGMAFCGQVENPQGSLQVNNYTANGCGQSCLFVDDLSAGPLDPTLSVNIDNFNASAANYYALDLETLLGCTRVSNAGIDNSSITPSGNIIGGGIQARNIRCHQQNQIVATTPGNSDIVQDAGVDTPAGNQYVQLSNLKLTNAAHSGLLDVISVVGFSTTRFSISHVITDTLQISTNSAVACSTTNPMDMLLSFDDVHVSHLYGGTYDTIYSQQGNASTMYYIQGKDSDLGRVDYTSINSNPLATDLDYFRVFEQTVTYSGSITRIGRATTTWNNPFSTFACPT